MCGEILKTVTFNAEVISASGRLMIGSQLFVGCDCVLSK
jgi:hypothetical protein